MRMDRRGACGKFNSKRKLKLSVEPARWIAEKAANAISIYQKRQTPVRFVSQDGGLVGAVQLG